MLDYGVTFIDPKNAYISEQASIGRDTIIYPNVIIEGESEIGDGCTIRSGTRITNSRIGHGVEILDNCVIADSEISEQLHRRTVRASSRATRRWKNPSKVGNFVELKKTILGRGSKASHLTYLGDATIGEKTNIGAGTITCNYDGKNKHATDIGRQRADRLGHDAGRAGQSRRRRGDGRGLGRYQRRSARYSGRRASGEGEEKFEGRSEAIIRSRNSGN